MENLVRINIKIRAKTRRKQQSKEENRDRCQELWSLTSLPTSHAESGASVGRG